MTHSLTTRLRMHQFPILIFLLCVCFYGTFAYDLAREDSIKLLSLYSALFFLSFKFFQFEKGNLRILMGAALVFRLVFLFSIPELSQDFYRFIWDGHLLLQGMSPYLWTPEQYFTSFPDHIPGSSALFSGMGSLSAGNPTNYPPLNQLTFAIASYFGGKSVLATVIVLRLIIIAADVGIFILGRKLLRAMQLPENRIFWFLLNPFVIIELTGNLHFEGLMIFFLMAAIWSLKNCRWNRSAVYFACSVLVKLVPLIFLPLLLRYLGLKKALRYYGWVILICLLSFLPFLSGPFLTNYFHSINLWFQQFEFNASIYYVVRWLGYQIKGYNIIDSAGPILGLLVFSGVWLIAFFKRMLNLQDLLTAMLFSFTLYLFLATTVHPWYLATPLVLSLFTRFRYVFAWSFVVVLSYLAYQNPQFEENLWWVFLEYTVVFGLLGYELRLLDFQKIRNWILSE